MRRSNPAFAVIKLDCFASLAMTNFDGPPTKSDTISASEDRRRSPDHSFEIHWKAKCIWINYALATFTVLGFAAALFCWRLYKDAIRREIATSEVMCSVLLSPPLHIEFQNIAYERIGKRFPPGEDNPSELEVALLQHELMTALGDASFLYVNSSGAGVTLRRILGGPFVVGRNPDEQWRYTKP